MDQRAKKQDKQIEKLKGVKQEADQLRERLKVMKNKLGRERGDVGTRGSDAESESESDKEESKKKKKKKKKKKTKGRSGASDSSDNDSDSDASDAAPAKDDGTAKELKKSERRVKEV
jgi:hypothetical protein